METTAAAIGPVQTEYISLFALSRAMRLEAMGMKLSRGTSALAIAKKRLGVTGSRAKVAQALQDALDAHPGNPRNA